MTVTVFCGPTLSAGEVASVLGEGARLRGPAAQGDVLDAAMDQPDAIALIDGYFDRVSSVWHKEILWALSHGIHVFGAASMGALRATELEAFGMRGHGAIFDAFRSGRWTDDDEVAVTHGPAEDGYRQASVALADMRATFAEAGAAGVISPAEESALLAAAKRLYYPDRNYPAVLAEVEGELSREGRAGELRAWLVSGRVHAKRDDALSLLRVVAAHDRAGWHAHEATFEFCSTSAWEGLRRAVTARRGDRASDETAEGVLDELLVTGGARAALDAATARALGIEMSQQSGAGRDDKALDAVIGAFRDEHGLATTDEFQRWLDQSDLSTAEGLAFFRREAEVRAARSSLTTHPRRLLADWLRSTGDYPRLTARARRKRAALAGASRDVPEARDAPLDEARLWQWFFRERMRDEVPGDLAQYARSQGINLDRLRSAIAAEYRFFLAGGDGTSS
jgi:hypothetical protein